MKRLLLLAILMVSLPALTNADSKKKKPEPEPAKEEIHWITSIDELQEKMTKAPKKVYVDVYTNWCGWCKKMDATTFQNPALVKYMNANFYAVRLDAERQDVIHFQGREYSFDPQYKSNTFAVELLKGRMSYPTAVIMLENFQNATPIPGYMTVAQLEVIMSYFGDDAYRHVAWDEYQKTYHPSWDHGEAPDMTPPPAHGIGHSPGQQPQ